MTSSTSQPSTNQTDITVPVVTTVAYIKDKVNRD